MATGSVFLIGFGFGNLFVGQGIDKNGNSPNSGRCNQAEASGGTSETAIATPAIEF